MHKLYFLSIFILAISLQACGNPSPQPQVQPEPNSSIETLEPAVVEEIAQEISRVTQPSLDGKTRITGIIRYDGEAPKFREIKMDGDPICLTKHTGPVYPQTLLLGKDKTLGNIFVYIKSGLPSKAYAPPTEEIIIDQKGCMYDPHVAGVMVGQSVKFLNPDGTLHNIHSFSKINSDFNIAMPKFRTELSMTFEKSEFMFSLKCDVHPWMGAWISVMDHPYFQVTKKDGQYSLEGLPAGTYVMEAWHERLGVQEQTITIGEGETKEINFVFSKPN